MLKKKAQYQVAVVGATGAVGREMISILEERNFPIGKLILLASSRSKGKRISFRGEELEVRELSQNSFGGVDLALFSAGGSTSKMFAPNAINSGCIVIDNSSAFRLEKEVPLVVPEINPDAIGKNPEIISNPNCSSIQMVVVIKPIHDCYRIKRVVVSTYQAVSGSGQKAMEELVQQSIDFIDGKEIKSKVYPHNIAFNCLPHIDEFLENGYTKEEMKMVNETRKILEDNSIQISPTAVRVPVMNSHSESVNVETEKPINLENLRSLLKEAPGIELLDDPKKNKYPLANYASGKNDVFVGRIRPDISKRNAVNFWVVSDNLRKGAALNAVQIAELLLRKVNR